MVKKIVCYYSADARHALFVGLLVPRQPAWPSGRKYSDTYSNCSSVS